jgi:hypothetical protein
MATADKEGDLIDYSRGVNTLTDYFDLLVSGNLESAGYLWRQDIYERAARFGIEYTGIPLKVDCNSPIVRNLGIMQDHLQPPVKSVAVLQPENFSRLEFNNIVQGQVVKHSYFTEYLGNYPWLIHAQDYYARDWPIVESGYFRIHAHPDVAEFLTQATLAAADRFVEAMADSLHLDKALVTEMADSKIEYFYCNTDTTVKQIIGHQVQGTFDLPTNDIISATFPHFHELLHLLVNARLKKLPLFTMPLFREGIAVRYGGRWGKGSNALADLGIFMHRQQIVPFDSILTFADFSNYSGADIAYPVAGVFTGYLLDRMGLDRYLQLYLAFSGSFEELNALTTADVQTKIAELTGQADWDAVMTGFNEYLDQYSQKHGVARPGGLAKGKALVTNAAYAVSTEGDWVAFDFTCPATDTVAGTILWGKDDGFGGGQSALFKEQFRTDRVFGGYRYSVRFDQFEVGLYDYASNQLLAKYIWGITPSDDYYDEPTRTVHVCFKKAMVTSLPENDVVFFRP